MAAVAVRVGIIRVNGSCNMYNKGKIISKTANFRDSDDMYV